MLRVQEVYFWRKHLTIIFCISLQIKVQLFSIGVVRGKLKFYDKHYGFALISGTTAHNLFPPASSSFSKEVYFAEEEVILLGRDENFNMLISGGKVLRTGPNIYERNHYRFIQGVVYEVRFNSVLRSYFFKLFFYNLYVDNRCIISNTEWKCCRVALAGQSKTLEDK